MNPSEIRFLVVDDYPDLRRLGCVLLNSFGYPLADKAVDGEEALEKLRTGRYDFVLTDLHMPRLDGFGLLRAIKTDPILARIPVIIWSGDDSNQYVDYALRLGAAAFLSKSVGREVLKEAIERALPDQG